MLAVLRRHGVDVAVPAVLVVVATVPLLPVFGTARLLVTVVVAVLAGALLAVLAAARRWGAAPLLAATLVAFVVLSALGAPTTALGGVVPTPRTIGAVAAGVVTSWKEIVTLAPPLGSGENLLTAPYVMALVGAVAAVSVAVRTRFAPWALAVPAAVLVASILLGTPEALLAVPVGLLAAVAGLLWAAWRTGRLQAGRPAAVGILAVAAALGAGALGTAAPPAADRFVLREVVEPPLDPHAYPSPLVEFRRYVKDLPEETLLTLRGMPEGTPVRLAVLDSYDGTVWAAGGPGYAGAGTFRRVAERVAEEVPDDALTVEVEVGAYEGVWLPQVGRTYDVDLAAGEQARSLYYNRTTGTGIVAAGLGPGDAYELTFTVPPAPSVSALEGAPVASTSVPGVLWPDVVPTVAAEMTAEADTPLAQVQAVETAFQEGYFSHGLEGDYPSRPGHGAERLAALLDEEPMVGDPEQYAAAMALVLRSLGVPSRVVMGFEAPAVGDDGVAHVVGDDVTAWVEVPFVGHGWVAFHPTPDEDRVPQDQTEAPQDRPQPQVLQPPPPAPEPPEAPPSDRQDVDVDDSEEPEDERGSVALLVAAAVAVPLVVALGPLALLVLAKVLRARRRRTRGTPARRVAGGWAEVLDTATDLGIALTPTATRSQAARELEAALVGAAPRALPGEALPGAGAGASSVAVLAREADAGTFGPEAPSEERAATYWADVARGLEGLRAAVGRKRWWRARVSTRSLRRRS